MKHCKVEFPDDVYEVVREAAYRARTPITRWVQRVAVETASEFTGLPLPCVPAAPQVQEPAGTAEAKEKQTENEETL